MSAKIICFGSAKGGAGKTVTTASIAHFLAVLGKSVLLVDTDAATNGLTLLYLQEVVNHTTVNGRDEHQPLGVYEVGAFTRETLQPVILPSGVHLLPATYHFLDTEGKPLGEYKIALNDIIALSRAKYDYIILDAQAGSDAYAQYAMTREVSDVVVLVSEYDPMSAAGIERLKGLMPQDLTYIRTWILLNKVLPEFARQYGSFLEVSRFLSPIPWDADVVRAYSRRRLALDLDRGNTYTLAVMQTLRSLLGDEIEGELTKWAQSRADVIKRPIELQYQDLERELSAIMQNTRELLRSGRRGLRRWFLPRHDFDLELERAKLERRRSVIEDQLRQLEVLRAADPETLIRIQKDDFLYKRGTGSHDG